MCKHERSPEGKFGILKIYFGNFTTRILMNWAWKKTNGIEAQSCKVAGQHTWPKPKAHVDHVTNNQESMYIIMLILGMFKKNQEKEKKNLRASLEGPFGRTL